MQQKINSFLWLVLISSVLVSCSKSTDTPYSLKQILKRNEVTGNGGSGTGGGAGAGGGAPAQYSGSNSAVLRKLLSSVSGWRTPSCATCNDGIPPNVKVSTNCIRDTYVAAAVNYAWAAESYYRLGNTSQASAMVSLMNESLQDAKNLCSNAPGVGGASCLTFSIFPC